jgi:GNAT superfamily N-acetyltransferase
MRMDYNICACGDKGNFERKSVLVMAEITVREAELGEILDLRHRVLRAGLPREAASFEGDESDTTKHVAARVDGRVVGCATILLNEWNGEPAWQLRGMAVDEEYRGAGVGRSLLEAIEKLVEGSLIQLIWCNARVPAHGFYRRMGWEVVSGVFDVPTAGPHVKMVKRMLSNFRTTQSENTG